MKTDNSTETQIDIDRWKNLQNLNRNDNQPSQAKTDSYFCGSPGK